MSSRQDDGPSASPAPMAPGKAKPYCDPMEPNPNLPPVVDREAVARLICPEAFSANTLTFPMWEDTREGARIKADAILALLPVGTGDAEAGWRTVNTAPKDEWVFVSNPTRGRFPLVAKLRHGVWENFHVQEYLRGSDEPTHWRPLFAVPPADREGK